MLSLKKKKKWRKTFFVVWIYTRHLTFFLLLHISCPLHVFSQSPASLPLTSFFFSLLFYLQSVFLSTSLLKSLSFYHRAFQSPLPARSLSLWAPVPKLLGSRTIKYWRVEFKRFWQHMIKKYWRNAFLCPYSPDQIYADKRMWTLWISAWMSSLIWW